MSTNKSFKKSTYSSSGNCVEVALGDTIRVRDSKNPNTAELSFTQTEWDAFLKGVRSNEFDL